MDRLRVYISGPITAGNRNKNFAQAADAQKALMLAGFAPMNPMATMTLPFAWDADVPHHVWMECDFPWVEVAHAVLRLPGYSVGADAEVQHAMQHGIPVFFGLDQLAAWRESLREAA